MNRTTVLLDTYSLFRRKTPLPFDCGSLCGKECCRGDEKTGMLLFPGEAHFFEHTGNIFPLSGQSESEIYVCHGSCKRSRRPLACRIYPLFPLATEKDGKIEIRVIWDPRAHCVLENGAYRLSRDFVRAVKRAGEYLCRNEETKQYLLALSEELSEYSTLRRLLGGRL